MSEKKKPFGRPTKYKEEYCKEIVEFFNKPKTEIVDVQKIYKGEVITAQEERGLAPPTLFAYAAHIGVCHDTLNEWRSKYPDFSAAVRKAKALQMKHITENSMEGKVNTAFAIFMLKNVANWTDRVEQKVDATVKSYESLIDETYKEDE